MEASKRVRGSEEEGELHRLDLLLLMIEKPRRTLLQRGDSSVHRWEGREKVDQADNEEVVGCSRFGCCRSLIVDSQLFAFKQLLLGQDHLLVL